MFKKSFVIFFILIIIFCFIFLSFLTFFYKPPSLNLFDFNFDFHLNKSISLNGLVKNVVIKDNILFFEICQYSRCLDCVIFNFTSFQKDLVYKKSLDKSFLEVIGLLTEYNNKPEIIVYRLI
ncbi:MAG: hypothetical protein PHR26_02670 [Candidatus ainarchaeum sp.]|nr:hypothetical protein [Candidatus ainarchaeum sp.]MDD3975887.1 hypothetical protein [Candidatus ainarchaeum sp.]